MTRSLVFTLALAAMLLLPGIAAAHCDSLDGPVLVDARAALAAGDITVLLKWVRPEDEATIAATFEHTLAVRSLSDEARQLADRYFFETVVRVHRAGEGFPFTGLLPEGSAVSPAIRESDRALESGSVDDLANLLTSAIEHQVRARFAHALEARQHANESVDKGREFVEAYVSLTHFAEEAEALASGHGGHSGP